MARSEWFKNLLKRKSQESALPKDTENTPASVEHVWARKKTEPLPYVPEGEAGGVENEYATVLKDEKRQGVSRYPIYIADKGKVTGYTPKVNKLKSGIVAKKKEGRISSLAR